MMKISVITVCFNEEKNISSTLDSILNQTSDCYELIIKDGGSTDKTIEVVNSYKLKFQNKNIKFIFKTEKDGGIYYGMNAAIELANSDYCIFMNGGDFFYNNNVIKDVTLQLKSDIDVFYGDFILFNEEKYKKIVTSHEDLPRDCTICHQATFIRTDLLKKRLYNVNYKYAADYEYWLFLLSSKKVFAHYSGIVCYFRDGGASVLNASLSGRECNRIKASYYQDSMYYNKEDFKCNDDEFEYSLSSIACNTGFGWSVLEEKGSWTVGNCSEFYFNLGEIENKTLTINILDTIGYSNKLYVNDIFVQDFPAKACNVKFKIEKELLKYGINKFSIKTEDYLRPICELKNTIDSRMLNLYIQKTSLKTFSEKDFSENSYQTSVFKKIIMALYNLFFISRNLWQIRKAIEDSNNAVEQLVIQNNQMAEQINSLKKTITDLQNTEINGRIENGSE